MPMGGYQYFAGRAYRFNPAIRQYQTGPNGRRKIHRDTWSETYGNIPHGWEVHHKDENVHNNDLSNLQCMAKRDHMRLHRAALNKRVGESNKEKPRRLGYRVPKERTNATS